MNMIRLRQLLREFEAGKLLWADPTSIPARRKFFWDTFITKIYGDETEPDSAEERDALNQIYQYLSAVQSTPEKGFSVGVKELPDPKAFVSDLLKLKRKFPKMLDPEHDIDNSLVVSGDDWIFRGMTADVDMLVQVIERTTSWDAPLRNFGWIGINNPDVHIRSRAAGFMSFTTSGLAKAEMFSYTGAEGSASRWNIVIAVPYNSVKTRAVLAPSFIEALSGYDESEIWVLEGSVKPEVLFIRDPWAGIPGTVSLAGKRVAAALQQNPTSPRYNQEFF